MQLLILYSRCNTHIWDSISRHLSHPSSIFLQSFRGAIWKPQSEDKVVFYFFFGTFPKLLTQPNMLRRQFNIFQFWLFLMGMYVGIMITRCCFYRICTKPHTSIWSQLVLDLPSAYIALLTAIKLILYSTTTLDQPVVPLSHTKSFPKFFFEAVKKHINPKIENWMFQ